MNDEERERERVRRDRNEREKSAGQRVIEVIGSGMDRW